ncbi:MAG: chromosome segregation protein SMC [Proteobacteria bacterium]|nr:chromosome segregation protein SMC [Pseudomonadota bacterium]
MRLNKIKLAGFKSFVDPTTIHLMSNLTAVAGPNGCGKSNVIDAVRWVMGESSAKHLRGGALTDVIFNGSSARKPVGQATVELLFDNTEGKLGGEYAAYTDIAIKRQVTREGISTYFLNGQRCRRKDITDIFLGTGLGPRSYAIIEQGMITRVIEAKPEDLRNFLEEAAGISKYKERRKETENRIQHTHDNIARVNDIRAELEKQLNRLQRQSQAAEQFKILKAVEKETSAQLAALMWQRLDSAIKENDAKIRELLVKLEEEQSYSQRLKTDQEKQRLAQIDANEAFNDVQKHYYSVGGEIAKIEQTIQHHQERQQQLLLDKQEAEQMLLLTQSQLKNDQVEILSLQQQISDLSPQVEVAKEASDASALLCQQAETAQELWREKAEQIQREIIIPSRQAEAEKAKITQLERQIHQTQERLSRLQQALAEQSSIEIPECDVIEEKIFICQEQLDNMTQEVAALFEQRDTLESQAKMLRPEIKVHQQALNEIQAQLLAMQTLQACALGKDQELKKTWLQSKGIGEFQYVAEKIEVTSGWEIAVETVLEGFLESIALEQDKVSLLSSHLESLQEGGISLIAWQNNPQQTQPLVAQTLASCIKHSDALPASIYQYLNSVHLANSLELANEMIATLLLNESVITPQGYWLGHGFARVKATTSDIGILQREENIKIKKQEIEVLQEKLDISQQSLEDVENKLKTIAFDKETKQQQTNKCQQDIIALQGELRIKQNKKEQIQKRIQQIQLDETECKEIIYNAQTEVQIARQSLQQALDKMSLLTNDQETLQQSKLSTHEAVINARLKVKETASKFQQMTMDLQTFRTQGNALSNNIDRFNQQIQQGELRVNNLIQSLAKNDEPINSLKEALELNVEKRIIIENQLNQARDNVANVDNIIREIETKLGQLEIKVVKIREQLEETKMLWQALQVRCEGALEKLKNTDYVLETLLETMPVGANEEEWQCKIEELDSKIQKLGPINLAAIEEYEAALTRKEYLDQQCEDLLEALTTLENAIKKIDKETRAKFQETFEKVNDSFTKLFPQLFGGGQAQLTMTGEDLLDTGITLMARPPGKKNSTIQLLSGGEKALTAVALVFSIFQLNPAPFCMLDEVDAPLDDNNVGRFCNLVKEMSKTIQFIYVSHNKLAIEMAEQLQGVTMREPGVSRLVTVDIEEAKAMAE